MTESEAPMEPGLCLPEYEGVAERVRGMLESHFRSGQPILLNRDDGTPVGDESDEFGEPPTVVRLTVAAAVNPRAGYEWLVAVNDQGRSVVAGHPRASMVRRP